MKKSIDTMGTSFLDLLSGALGAVILLFVLVPKTTITDKELIDQMKSLEIESSQLDSLMIQLANSSDTISVSDYLQVVEQVKKLQAKNELMVDKMSKQLANAQERIAAQKRNELKLKNDARVLEQKMNELINRQKSMASVQSTSKSKSTSTTATTSTDKRVKSVKDSDKAFYFGFDAELSIVLNWDSSEVDVDLYLENDGKFCDGFNRTKSFGKWVRVPKKYLSRPTEVIIQQKLVPGTYKVHAHVSRPRRSGSAKINGFVAMDLGGAKTRKFEFKSKTINSGPPPYHKRADGSTLIGTLEVTDSNISFTSN